MNTTFAERIKELRKRKNLSLVQMAERTGVSAASLGFYEQGKRAPDINTLNMLCDFFGVSADYLLCRNNVDNPNIELQAIGRITGLSNKAIQVLSDEATERGIIPLVNFLIEQEKNISVSNDDDLHEYLNSLPLLHLILLYLKTEIPSDARFVIEGDGIKREDPQWYANYKALAKLHPATYVEKEQLESISRLLKSIKGLKKHHEIEDYNPVEGE